MSGQSRATAVQVGNQLPANPGVIGAPLLPCAQNKDPQLSVRVYAIVKGKRRAVQATVTANALTQASAAGTGIADFSYVLPGAYRVKAAAVLAPDDQVYWAPAVEQQVTLARGDKRRLDIEVKPRNVVTPKVDVEYKVVLLDRGLAQIQATAGELPGDLLPPDPTRVEVWMESSTNDPPYTGEGTLSAPGCDVFLDAACQQPLGGRKLTNAELAARTPLYMRGTAAGLFTLTLTLDADPDPRIQVEPGATVDMGVVELQLEVFQHATPVMVSATTYPLKGYCADLENPNLIPAEVALSHTDKVTQGRLLHKQAKQHHGRAKALVHIAAGEWPAGTDDYQVVVRCTGSDLRAYDAETKGKKQSLPWKLKVADLKAADQAFWVEGADTSKKIRGSRLFLGIDRGPGGLAKQPKTHGDWARFTVVNIASVRLHYTAPGAGQPKPYDPAKHRWFINLQAGDAGRTVKIRAKLSQKIQGIELHFMLSPDKHNLKKKNWRIDLPATWNWASVAWDVKQRDRSSDTELLHKAEKTDADGMAECDLVLSQFGGDRYMPAAYIGQDPHLAAYVQGHDTLSERKPKLADDAIQVYRKFWLQRIAVRDNGKVISPNPGFSGAKDQYGRVRALLEKARSTPAAAPAGSSYPKSMITAGGGSSKGLLVSDLNKGTLFGGVAADPERPVKVPVLVCDAQWDSGGDKVVDVPWEPLAGDIDLTPHVQSLVVVPYLDGTPTVQSGALGCRGKDAAGTVVSAPAHAIADADMKVKLNKAGNESVVTLILPPALQAFARQHRDVEFEISSLKLQICEGPYLGESSGGNIMAVYDPKDRQDFQNTIVHELGHFFSHTLEATDVTALTAAGIPPIATQYISWLDIADITDLRTSGSHCHTDSTPYTHATSARPGYKSGKCVMYESGPVAGSYNRYCDGCHPYVLVTDMAK